MICYQRSGTKPRQDQLYERTSVVITTISASANGPQGTPPVDIPAKFSGLRAEAGDVITYLSPGGGGYGPSLKRDPQKVLDDYITPDHARDVYGVVVKPVTNGYQWGLDLPATATLRAAMQMA